MVNDLFTDSVEPDFYENTSVFVNLKNETNPQKLKELEAGFTAVYEYLLFEDSSLLPCEFNLTKLKSIHSFLFKELYSWAGKTRSYDMSKNGDEFTPAKDLPKHEAVVFSRAENVLSLVKPEKIILAEKLARCLGILNMYHPFPEGNGRTQRIFISLLARTHDYLLDWDAVQAWENMETSKRVHEGNYEPLTNLMLRILYQTET
ncbi:Fic/DOC family protein [Moritella yayanosii]|uniref:protein adenylyltransferase n=1 Tax=Moritella yayanosii TaxID=69539 RepID=A0A330LN06_9GAMM|nr:Fic family protein [Moritella yayanosii]SQD77596.1 putative Fic family protein [Moritella yayanosii]